MTAELRYDLNTADGAAVATHLAHCDADFIPALSSRVKIAEYADKIAGRATRFEAWSGETLVGLVAAYFDTGEPRVVHITNVSVLREHAGQGIAAALMEHCLERAMEQGIGRITLEVGGRNAPAVRLYEKFGFRDIDRIGEMIIMECTIGERPKT
jgi:ribosomal protein S18 acetylase RimI-like enzyme